MTYAIVIEHERGTSYSAYVPDLPGCVGAAGTLPELKALMNEAVRIHVDGLRRHGYPVPTPMTLVDSVNVAEEAAEVVSH